MLSTDIRYLSISMVPNIGCSKSVLKTRSFKGTFYLCPKLTVNPEFVL